MLGVRERAAFIALAGLGVAALLAGCESSGASSSTTPAAGMSAESRVEELEAENEKLKLDNEELVTKLEEAKSAIEDVRLKQTELEDAVASVRTSGDRRAALRNVEDASDDLGSSVSSAEGLDMDPP